MHSHGGRLDAMDLTACAGIMLAAYPAVPSAQQMIPGSVSVTTNSVISVYTIRIKLTSEEAAAVQEVLMVQSDNRQEMFRAVQGQGREAMMEMRPKMEQLGKETSEQVEALLTEDQIPEYRKIQAENQERRQSMRQRQPGG